MKNRLLLNGLLILVIISLASLIWLKPGIKEEQTQSLSHLSGNLVNKITIHRADQQDIQLEKKDQQWYMVSPQNIPASNIKVKLLLTLLSEKINSEYPAEGKDLKQFGLEPENISIQYNEESKIIFGMSHPISYDRYILKDNKILLISETVYGALKADIASFFNTHLIPTGKKVTKVELPESYPSGDNILTNWQLANAVEVFTWDSKKQPSKGTIKLSLNNGEKLQYEIVETLPELMLGNAKLKAKYQIPEENLIGLGLKKINN